jgi:hypothetical protein
LAFKNVKKSNAHNDFLLINSGEDGKTTSQNSAKFRCCYVLDAILVEPGLKLCPENHTVYEDFVITIAYQNGDLHSY